MFVLTALVATLLVSVSAIVHAPTPTLAINPAQPPLNQLSRLDSLPLPGTNAGRLARGLPPRSPNFNRPRAARPSPSFMAFNAFATRSAVSRRATHKALAPRASAVPCAARDGTVRVVGDGINGFVLAAPNDFGEFGYTGDVAEALRVRIGCAGDALDIATLVRSKIYPPVALLASPFVFFSRPCSYSIFPLLCTLTSIHRTASLPSPSSVQSVGTQPLQTVTHFRQVRATMHIWRVRHKVRLFVHDPSMIITVSCSFFRSNSTITLTTLLHNTTKCPFGTTSSSTHAPRTCTQCVFSSHRHCGGGGECTVDGGRTCGWNQP